MTAIFCQTTFETRLIETLVGMLRKGRKGRKATHFVRARAEKTLYENGYTPMDAYHVFHHCWDMAELQILCEESA